MNKYGAKKTTVDGIMFDSKHEAERWCGLKLLEKSGVIHDLQRQVRFELIPALKDENGKVIQRAINYVADFVYLDNDGTGWRKVVEDAKGMKTEVYKLKKKVMRWKYGIEIKEV